MTRPKIAVHILSAAFLTAALGLGAAFGDLTSPDAPPAHADMTKPVPCGIYCADTITGSGGNTSPKHR